VAAPTGGSVTRWLGELQAGDAAAAQPLWERYIGRLVGLARKKLQNAPCQAADARDVALSAFASFCRNAEAGKFPQLADRDGLWRLLVVLTARKAAHLLRDAGRLKRGGAAAAVAVSDERIFDQLLSREPSPEFAAEAAEEFRRLLRLLGDSELETVALRRMEGYTVNEIAVQLGYVSRSIKRKLEIIRRIWEKEVAP
jgi:DNA-directed RNA polymerase specialized sigma24 family protein